jgi:L-alanine-DL-glutamate epimerase-like enolase superfamily enzyme
MRITAVRGRTVRMPLATPIRSRSAATGEVWLLLVDLDTDAGVTGSSYVWSYSAAGSAALQALLVDLADVAIGERPSFTARLWSRMLARLTQLGPHGLPLTALSAIDIAAWDAAGKALAAPVAQLLGAHTERVPVYASDGLWLTDDLPALAAEAERLRLRGFRAMKMRLGRARPADDLAAVRAVRDAVGPEVALMADVSQGWDVTTAIRTGRLLERYDLTWLEEPVRCDDFAGHAAVAAALDTPVATGEKLYGPRGVRDLIEHRAADILMPDAQRAGGISGWRDCAALAHAWNLPITAHLLPEISIHLVSAAPTALFLEHVSWAAPLFNEELELSGGMATVPDRPGLGFTWNEAAIARVLADPA